MNEALIDVDYIVLFSTLENQYEWESRYAAEQELQKLCEDLNDRRWV